MIPTIEAVGVRKRFGKTAALERITAGIDDNSGRCYNRDDAGAITATTSRAASATQP